MSARVLEGDCLSVLPTLDADSVDAVVTDPPYGLGFMGKAWDTFAPEAVARNVKRDTRSQKRRELYGGKESDAPSAAMAAARYDARRDGDFEALMFDAFAAALRVAKPGAHLVAFGSPRRHHRLMCAIENAGWEIRDCLSYLYGSGFPKSHNGAWGGTALKPAWEPIILARKALIGTVAANHAEHGTGALNIDSCRIGVADADYARNCSGDRGHADNRKRDADFAMGCGRANDVGRWPANVVLDEDAARELDAQSGELTTGTYTIRKDHAAMGYGGGNGSERHVTGDSGGASRFFYTARAGRTERNAGLEDHPNRKRADVMSMNAHDHEGGIDGRGVPYKIAPTKNHHPTVKPLDLMQWLCRLVTPKGGLILDPFCGSGSTGRAAIAEGFSFIGIELSPEYAEIARARIAEYAPLFGDPAA